MRYSNDLRQKAMEMHFVQNQKMVVVSKLLDICYDTLKRWKKKFKDNPDSLYIINPSPGRPRVYNYPALEEFVKNNPDKYIREIKQEFFEEKDQKASFGGIHKALKKLDISFKKNPLIQRKRSRKKTRI
jgi:transposase